MFFFLALCVFVILLFILVEALRQLILFAKRRWRQRRAAASEDNEASAARTITINTQTPPLASRIPNKKQRQDFLANAINSGTVLKTSEDEIMGDFGDLDGIINIKEMSCTICLVEYEHGEDIAQSSNQDCSHVFHRKCILEWLVQNNECPCCRGSFVDLEQGCNDALCSNTAAAVPEQPI